MGTIPEQIRQINRPASVGRCGGQSHPKGVIRINPRKEKYIRAALWTAVVIWMGLIFMFSAQTAVESSETSRSALDVVMEILGIENAEEIFADEKLFGTFDFLIRKSAHFCIFAVLGGLLTAAISRYTDAGTVGGPVIAFPVGVLYALSDELHQYFVPGRASQFRDVCIDSAGVLFGCALVYAVMKWAWARKRSKLK